MKQDLHYFVLFFEIVRIAFGDLLLLFLEALHLLLFLTELFAVLFCLFFQQAELVLEISQFFQVWYLDLPFWQSSEVPEGSAGGKH